MNEKDQEQRLDLSFTRNTKDMAVAALVGAVIAALLFFLFFFTFRSNVKDYGSQIQDISIRLNQMESRIDSLESIPTRVQGALIRDMIMDLSRQSDVLAAQIQDPEQKKKLEEVKTILEELEQSITTP